MQRKKQESSRRHKVPQEVKAGARGAAPARGRRIKRKRLWAELAILLAGLVVLTLAVSVYVGEKKAKSALSVTVEPVGSSVAAAVPPLPETPAEPPPEAPVEEVAPPPPQTLEVPAGGWDAYAFSEAEVTALNGVLDGWAATAQPEVEPAASNSDDSAAEGGPGQKTPEDPDAGHRVAVYFRDLHSGAEYIYNGEEKLDVASLSKAPYAMYLYQLVEQGQASLDEKFLIDAESIKGSEENSGRLKDDPNLPRELTLAEMIEYLLRHSDTVAQRVLLKKYPAAGYAAWAAGLGLHHPEDVRGVTSGFITAVDAGVYLAALRDYMDAGLYGKELQAHLMNTTNPMIRTPWPLARKYGWDKAAFHDMAVVYAPHPYLIAILTDKSAGTQEDRAQFSAIPQMLEQILARHWAEAELGPNTKQGVD